MRRHPVSLTLISICLGLFTVSCQAPRDPCMMTNSCKSSQDVYYVQTSDSDSSKLMMEMFRIIIEDGYGDKMHVVQAANSASAVDLLNSGAGDVALELDSAAGLAKGAETFDALFEGDTSVKAVSAQLVRKDPEVVELVKKMSVSADRKKRAVTKAIKWMTDNNLSHTTASIKAMDNMRTQWESWVPDSVRDHINDKMNAMIEELRQKGIELL